MSGAQAPSPPPSAPVGRAALGSRAARPAAASMARRRWTVSLAKWLLPAVALGLLSLLAIWPELASQADKARLVYRRGGLVPDSGMLTSPRYMGEDESRQPYTLTAASARQIGPERIDLTLPVGDIILSGGSWVQVNAARGVFVQKLSVLDLEGEVTLYRDDGTMLVTDAVTVDLREGAAAGSGRVRVEGPFGTLDAQGFTLTDRGHVVQFHGPGRLVLNGGGR